MSIAALTVGRPCSLNPATSNTIYGFSPGYCASRLSRQTCEHGLSPWMDYKFLSRPYGEILLPTSLDTSQCLFSSLMQSAVVYQLPDLFSLLPCIDFPIDQRSLL
jgi:hypothetical protein